MSDPARLYGVDFFRWTQEQAALLRQVPDEHVNLPIDWNHAAEEIEDMGRSDLRTVNSRIGVILEHLLKLEHSPVGNPSPTSATRRQNGRKRLIAGRRTP